MVRSLFGPMVIEVLSTNRICTDPSAAVLMRSLCAIEEPMVMVRKLAVAAGLTADALPTSCASAGCAAMLTASTAPVAISA